MHTVRTTVGHRSRVPELAGDLCAGLVDRISQPSQSRGRLGVDDDDLLDVGRLDVGEDGADGRDLALGVGTVVRPTPPSAGSR